MLDFSPFDISIKQDGMALVEASLSSHEKTDYAIWDHDRICLVKRGRITLDYVAGNTELSDRDIIYLPAGVKHRWITPASHSAALFMICYDKGFFTAPPAVHELFSGFGRSFPALEKFSPDSTIRAGNIRYLFNKLMMEKRSKAPDMKVITLGLFITLATRLLRTRREIIEQKNMTSWEQSFNNSLKYLEENIQEKIGIAELARIAGLSYRRYTEIFKQQTGLTTNEYIRRKRIELARKLLQETGNILHASLDAGFGDLSHFYRVFKQVSGITPKQYIDGQAAISRD
ncbi:hypothetical protein MNBD_ALPHA01-1924 [hydrothermal vent metagenome]|uniref:HTH araC/xylS-type domain-containing protein n=1 Tax=hydrothermal vent metagenome TaxID=652676 RepID=A0A3B0RHX9_9ZZZZ